MDWVWNKVSYLTSNLWGNLTIGTFFYVIIVLFFVVSVFFAKRKKREFSGLGNYTLDDVRSGKIFDDMKEEPSFIIRRDRKKKKKRGSKEEGKSSNKNEERCREIFEGLFPGFKFKSCRPDFLKNPVTGRKLELDGYNPDIVTPLGKGLAFEYDGEQHSRYSPHFHRGNVGEFKYQVARDGWKDTKCKKEGILLIRIPYYILPNRLEEYIIMQLKRYNLINS